MNRTSISPTRSHVLIVPLVFLAIALLQELLMLKLREHVRDIHVRAAITVLLNGVGFAFAANVLTPRFKEFLRTLRSHSRSGAGTLGVWLFYLISYGLVYRAYVVLEMRGASGLLPTFLR